MLQQFAQTYTDTFNTNSYSTPDSSTISHVALGLVIAYVVVVLLIVILFVIVYWRIFRKAGKHGWAALIPFYNIWTLAEVAGRPGWWGLLLFVPIVNVPLSLIITIELGQRFGKNNVFIAWLLYFLSPIGYLMLAFGKAKYNADKIAPAPPLGTLAPPSPLPTAPSQPPVSRSQPPLVQ